MTEIVSVEWLNQNINEENLIILDASLKSTADGLTTDLYQKTIPKSRYFDIKNSFSDKKSSFPNTFPTTKKFELECRKLGVNSESKIVVFDDLGIYSSPRVWWMFKVMGHRNVFVLNGGLPEWTKKGFKTVERQCHDFKIGDFKVLPQKQFILNYQNIVSNTIKKSFLIVDARSNGRFNGTEKEPRNYLKSGHIPNSINIPYSEVLENGKFKSKKELKKIFEKQCNEINDLVFSCGSGLTACIVMMASEIGYVNSKRIYDGSWTEWAELQNLKESVV